MKQRWCKHCKAWTTDGCEHAPAFNKALQTSKLNNHLYAQADRAQKEHTDSAHFVRAAKAEQKRVAGSS